jgi:plasmid stabilization system protein ParE
MNVVKTHAFLADIEQQYEWYVLEAGYEVADRYLKAVEAVAKLLSQQPLLGPLGRFQHGKIKTWRYFPALRPFNKHVLFYEVTGQLLILRRAMHGRRDLAKRLSSNPGQS